MEVIESNATRLRLRRIATKKGEDAFAKHSYNFDGKEKSLNQKENVPTPKSFKIRLRRVAPKKDVERKKKKTISSVKPEYDSEDQETESDNDPPPNNKKRLKSNKKKMKSRNRKKKQKDIRFSAAGPKKGGTVPTVRRKSERVRAHANQTYDKYVFDAETRSHVQAERILKLQHDNYDDTSSNIKGVPAFVPTYVDDSEEDEVYQSARKRQKQVDTLLSKISSFQSFEQVMMAEEFDEDEANYHNTAAKPSVLPSRHFCSICGFPSCYTCIRCGSRFCSTRCNYTHRETRCLKFAD